MRSIFILIFIVVPWLGWSQMTTDSLLQDILQQTALGNFQAVQRLVHRVSPADLKRLTEQIDQPEQKAVVLAYLANAEKRFPAKAEAYLQQAQQLLPQIEEANILCKVYNLSAAFHLEYGQYAEAEAALSTSESYANSIDFQAGEHPNRLLRSQLFIRQEKHLEAFHYLYQSLNDEHKAPKLDVKACGDLNYHLGLNYQSIDAFEKSLEHLKHAHEDFRLIDDSVAQAQVLRQIALLYESQKDYEVALAFLRKSNRMYTRIRDSFQMAEVQKHLGRVLAFQDSMLQAMQYFKMAHRYFSQYDNEYQALSFDQMGEAHFLAGDYAKAAADFEASLQLRQRLNNAPQSIKSYYWLAKVKQNLGQFDEARVFGLQALRLAEEQGLIEQQNKILQVLAQIANAEADWQQLASYRNSLLELKDSLTARSNRTAISHLDMQYRLQLELQKIEEAKAAENLRHQTQDRILYGSLIGIILLAVGLFFLLQQRRRRNQMLENKIKARTQELKYQATFLNNIIDSIPGVVYRTKIDESYTPLFISKGAKDIFGMTSDELVASRMKTAMLYSPAELRRMDQLTQHAITSGETIEMTSEITSFAQEKRWILDRFKAVYDEQAKAFACDGLIIDITDQINTEEALRNNEKQLSLIYENTQDQIILIDLLPDQQMILKSINQALRKAWVAIGFALNWDEYLNVPFEKYLKRLTLGDDKKTQRYLKILQRAIENKHFIRFEDVFVTSKLVKRYLEINIIPILNEQNVCEKLLLVMRDITEQKTAQDRMISTIIETEDRERSRIAKELHDSLGQNLTTASLNFNILKQELQELPARAQEKFGIGLKFLNVAIEESRNIAHNLMPQSIAEFGYVLSVESLIEDLQRSVENTEVLFYHNLKEERMAPEYELNLFRVTQEAINNALKYAQPKKIIIQLMKHENLLQLSIEDDGLGFETNDIERGFGLNSMRNRIRALLGHLTIDSSPNRGTIITAEVPIESNLNNTNSSKLSTKT